MSHPFQSEERRADRERMVRDQIARRGISNPRVLEAMTTVPRHWFVPQHRRDEAYEDRPLPIGAGQTISQPYVVAYMADVIGIAPGQRVLEIGAGCGYQAAVLVAMGADVIALEIVRELADGAQQLFESLGANNPQYHCADGTNGWATSAPYDAIIISCAAPYIPQVLFDQLALGGILVAPVDISDSDHQVLYRWQKARDGTLARTKLISVRFVPMTGAIERT